MSEFIEWQWSNLTVAGEAGETDRVVGPDRTSGAGSMVGLFVVKGSKGRDLIS